MFVVVELGDTVLLGPQVRTGFGELSGVLFLTFTCDMMSHVKVKTNLPESSTH